MFKPLKEKENEKRIIIQNRLNQLLDSTFLVKFPYTAIADRMKDERLLQLEFVGDDEFQGIPEVRGICRVDERRRNDEQLSSLFTCDVGKHERNLIENRNQLILPYDRTRVRLLEKQAYVNANYINDLIGVQSSPLYICSQLPPHQCRDFWSMVFEHETSAIVVLRDGDAEGSAGYLPDEFIASDTFYDTEMEPKFSITVMYKIDTGSEQLTVVDLMMKSIATEKMVLVRYIAFNAWPQGGIPPSTDFLLKTFDLVDACLEAKRTKVIVQSLLGAGRAGTWILAHQCLQKLLSYEDRSKARISIYQALLRMREQRMELVSNWTQYQFAYRLIYDGLVQHGFDFKGAK